MCQKNLVARQNIREFIKNEHLQFVFNMKETALFTLLSFSTIKKKEHQVICMAREKNC